MESKDNTVVIPEPPRRGRPPGSKNKPREGGGKLKPRGGNSPLIPENAINADPGDNAKYVMFNLIVSSLPKIDITDAEQLQTRVFDYYKLCADHDMRPTVNGFAMAVGLDRRRVWEIVSGSASNDGKVRRLSSACVDIFKKAHLNLTILWEQYMLDGKINPVAGVFLGVNHHGYQDVKQVNLTPVSADSQPYASAEDNLKLVDSLED